MFDVLSGPPLHCGVNKAYDAIDTTDSFTKRHPTSDDSHVFVRIPLVMHTTLALEVFADLTGAQEPDFLVAAAPSNASPTGSLTTPAPSAECDYDWLDKARYPAWDSADVPGSLVRWASWIQKSWLSHQRSLFEQCANTNERLQFEYASFLQGLTPDEMQVHVQRQDDRRVLTLAMPLFRSEDDQKKWRQLLFRVATSCLTFQAEEERQAVVQRLEDWKKKAPIQLQYGVVLVLKDSTPFGFSVARESLTFVESTEEGEGEGEGGNIMDIETLAGNRAQIDITGFLEDLKAELAQLIPVDLPSLPVSAPRLAPDAGATPSSFIDHCPALENYLVGTLAGDLFHWFDVVSCFTAEFGTPLYIHNFQSRDSNEPKSAIFSFEDEQSGLSATLQMLYTNQFQIPEITLTSTQYCLKNDGGALRIAVAFTEGDGGTKSKVLSMIGGRQFVNPVALSDETKSFLERVFPRFAQACTLHGQAPLL